MQNAIGRRKLYTTSRTPSVTLPTNVELSSQPRKRTASSRKVIKKVESKPRVAERRTRTKKKKRDLDILRWKR